MPPIAETSAIAEPDTPPVRFTFSTDLLPARDRFDFMREEIAARHLNYDVVNHSGPDYRGVIEASLAGDVTVGYLYGSPAKWERTKRALAEEAYALYESFRPSIPAGKRGWGAAGVLDLGRVRALAKE